MLQESGTAPHPRSPQEVLAAVRSARPAQRWIPAAIGAAALAAALFVAWPAAAAGGFPLDDAWISQSIARNLAIHGVWGFNPDRASSGATSILWTLLLAAAHWVGISPVGWTLGLSALLLAGFCVALHAMLRADGMTPAPAAVVAILPATLGNGVWLAATGLEHLLLAFLSVAAVRLWQKESAWTGPVCALAVLTRPEGLGVGLVLVAFTLFGARRRSFATLLGILAPVGLAWAGSSLLFLATGGGLLPATLEGRRWLLHLYRPEGWASAIDFLQAWALQLGMHALGLPASAAGWVVLAVAAAGAVTILRGGAAGVLASWALVWNLLYLVLLPTPGHGGRYQPLNLLLAPVLPAIGICAALGGVPPRWREWCRTAVALILAVPCLATLPTWRAITAAGVEQIEGAHRALAMRVRDLVPPREPIAAFDIGALRYYGEHTVVDLGGLVDRELLPYLREGRVPEYLQERGIGWVALPEDWTDGIPGGRLGEHLHLLGNAAFPLQSVAIIHADPRSWALAYRNTGHALPRLVLYRRPG